MEFLRFGSRIPGAYKWGCCAVCIIQDFSQDPDDLASIEVVSGDSGTPVLKNNEKAFCGPTYKDIFEQRLRIGTFNGEDMPNHVFLAIMTEDQINYNSVGQKWLKLLKENGFEFIRATDNSVYSGNMTQREFESLEEWEREDDEYWRTEEHVNYVFGLFRNIGSARVHDPFQPPKAWLDLEGGVKEVSSFLNSEQQTELEQNRYDLHLSQWDKIGPVQFLSRKELEEKGAPVILAGLFSENPQEPIQHREERNNGKEGQQTKAVAPTFAPW